MMAQLWRVYWTLVSGNPSLSEYGLIGLVIIQKLFYTLFPSWVSDIIRTTNLAITTFAIEPSI